MTTSLQVISSNQFSSMNIIEGKGLRVNMGWTKVLISGPGRNVLLKSSKVSCDVCLKGVDVNFIFCGVCSSCVLKKCSDIPGPLKPDASFWCKQCRQQARPVDGRPITEVTVGREKVEVVSYLFYLGDCLSSGGGCELTSITRYWVAWGKFSLRVRSAMPYASETCAPTSAYSIRPQPNDQAMLCSLTIWKWYPAPVDSDDIAM